MLYAEYYNNILILFNTVANLVKRSISGNKSQPGEQNWLIKRWPLGFNRQTWRVDRCTCQLSRCSFILAMCGADRNNK